MKPWTRLVWGVIVIIVGAIFLGQSPGPAGSAKPKIGVVELEEAVGQSGRGKEIINSLEAEIKEKESELDAEKAVIDQLKKEYEAKKSIWDEMTRKQKASDIDLKEQSLARKARDYQEYFMKKRFEAVRPLIKDFRELVERLGREQSYDIIFDISGAVLYVNETSKVTQEVVRYADSTLK
jgi:Skp family chaperone for outer membrane proteins